MGQHHGVLLCPGIGGVNLCVAVKVKMSVGLLAFIEGKGLIKGFLIKRICDCRVNLARHGHLDDLAHALESCVSALHADFADLKAGNILDQVHVQDIDRSGLKQCVADFFTFVEFDLRVSHKTRGLLERLDVSYDQRSAAVIERSIGQRLDSDLRAVAGRISHSDSNNRSFVHILYPFQNTLVLFMSSFILNSAIDKRFDQL